MKAVLICSGEIKDHEYIKTFINKDDLIICCDGGLRYCERLGVFPDIIAGDFDSADKTLIKKYENTKAEIFTLPCEKNFTDCEYGIEIAIKRGAEEITLLGCVGSRVDHSLSNIHMLLKPLKQGIRARIINENNIVFLADKGFSLDTERNSLLSLIPFTQSVKGIVTQGLYYPLKNEALTMGTSRGISNVCLGDKIKVDFEEGILIVILSKD